MTRPLRPAVAPRPVPVPRPGRRQPLAERAAAAYALAAVAHDLHQPLHALVAATGALALHARQLADPRLQRLADGMAQALQQAGGLVDQLPEVLAAPSRPAAGGAVGGAVGADRGIEAGAGLGNQRRCNDLVDVAALVNATVLAHGPLAALRGLALEQQVAPEAQGVLARSDAVGLGRIVNNLLANALKFTASGGVALRLALHHGGRLALTVADTGIGITAAEQALLLGAAVPAATLRSVSMPAAGGHGHGQGLATVRRLATQLGIGLALHSVRGQGTAFTLHLPVAVQPAGSATSAAAPAVVATTAAAKP